MASPPVTDWAEDEVEGFGQSYEEKRSFLLGVAAAGALRGRNTSVPVDANVTRNHDDEHNFAGDTHYIASGHSLEKTRPESSWQATSGSHLADDRSIDDALPADQRERARDASHGWQPVPAPVRGRSRKGLEEAFGRISVRTETTNAETVASRRDSPTKGRDRPGRRTGFDSAETASLNARIVGDVGEQANEFGDSPKPSHSNAHRTRRELPSQPPYRAYVGHVPAQIQEAQIREFFRGCCVSRVRLLRRGPASRNGVAGGGNEAHEASGAPSTEPSIVRAAFVDFADLESLSEALTRHGSVLEGSTVVVDVAQQAGHRTNSDIPEAAESSGRSRRVSRSHAGANPERFETQWSASSRRGGAPASGSKGSASGGRLNGDETSNAAGHGMRSHRSSRRGWVHVSEAHRGQITREQAPRPAVTAEKPSAGLLSRNNFAALATLDSSMSDEER